MSLARVAAGLTTMLVAVVAGLAVTLGVASLGAGLVPALLVSAAATGTGTPVAAGDPAPPPGYAGPP